MENELQKYLSIIWHWLWLIGLGIGLVTGAAYLSSRLTTPVYAASTRLLVNEAPNNATGDYASILIRSDRLALTYADMMTQQPVLDQVITELKLTVSLEDLQNQVKVTPIPNTQLIRLTVENEDPQLAADIANAIPVIFSQQNIAQQTQRYADSKANLTKDLATLTARIEQTQAEISAIGSPADPKQQTRFDQAKTELAQLQQSYSSLRLSYENIGLAEAQSISNIVVTERAQPPLRPVRPLVLQNTLLGAVVGLLLSLGLVFLIEYLDNSIRTPEQVRDVLGIPVIGLIAKFDGRQIDQEPDSRLIASKEARAPIVEAFRWLRTNIQIAGIDQPIRTVLVTSASQGEGKSMVAANLAVVMAQAGRKIILLDTDLRRPSVHRLFQQSNQTGLVDALLQEGNEWTTAVRRTEVEHLSIVLSGPTPPDPIVLLGSKRMQSFIEFLKNTSDTIVIDTPPVLPVADVLMLAPQVDGVVLVIEHGRTSLRAAQQAVTQLRQSGAHIWGAVLNQVPTHQRRYGYYAYNQDYSK